MTRRRKNKYNQTSTFDCMDYALSFDFCNRNEKKALYNVLDDAWKWAYPPEKEDKREKELV